MTNAKPPIYKNRQDLRRAFMACMAGIMYNTRCAITREEPLSFQLQKDVKTLIRESNKPALKRNKELDYNRERMQRSSIAKVLSHATHYSHLGKTEYADEIAQRNHQKYLRNNRRSIQAYKRLYKVAQNFGLTFD